MPCQAGTNSKQLLTGTITLEHGAVEKTLSYEQVPLGQERWGPMNPK